MTFDKKKSTNNIKIITLNSLQLKKSLAYKRSTLRIL